jgi:hypothetical protein
MGRAAGEPPSSAVELWLRQESYGTVRKARVTAAGALIGRPASCYTELMRIRTNCGAPSRHWLSTHTSASRLSVALLAAAVAGPMTVSG